MAQPSNQNLISKAILAMRNYCIPDRKINMPFEQTGVVEGLILYFIALEPTICRTKLECYIILLDRICKKETGTHLLDLDLQSNGRIRNFKKFIDFMIKMGLIFPKDAHKFYLCSKASNIIKELPDMYKGIFGWIQLILNKFHDKTAQSVLSFVTYKKNPKHSIIDRLNALIDSHTKQADTTA